MIKSKIPVFYAHREGGPVNTFNSIITEIEILISHIDDSATRANAYDDIIEFQTKYRAAIREIKK